jgi:CDP-diacylglycerol---glycerol-3-phosphate 3-phosphatidyltransferase
MHAVYRALLPLGRLLVSMRISASAVTATSLALAIAAAFAFAQGRLGVGAVIASVACLADAVDGIVARESGTTSVAGQILDTTVDRYVDAVLLGGLAMHVRHDAVLLLLVLSALVGSFMVSYASSLERELHRPTAGRSLIPMRRPHRLAYLLAGAALGPFAARVAGPDSRVGGLVPVMIAAFLIAVVGNVSAIRRLAAVARTNPDQPSPRPPPHVLVEDPRR